MFNIAIVYFVGLIELLIVLVDIVAESLLRILSSPQLRANLSNVAGRKSAVKRYMELNNIKGISVGDMMGLARDLSTAYSESNDPLGTGTTTDHYLDIVAKDLTSGNAAFEAEDDRQARQAMLQTFTQGFEDKGLGKSVFDAMVTDGGLLKNVGKIEGMLQGDVKGRVARRLKSAMSRDNLTGVNTQSAVMKRLTERGYTDAQIKAAGIFDQDDALSDTERSLASSILGFDSVASAELKDQSSTVARRANAMGMDIESVRDKAFKESLEAQATTLRAHTDFVRTVGDVVPTLRRSAENTEIINTQAGN